nr:hypothetical protein [Chloracidobacterium aggregatum]
MHTQARHVPSLAALTACNRTPEPGSARFPPGFENLSFHLVPAVLALKPLVFGRGGQSIKPGAAMTEDELRDWCKAQMAAYKYPRLIEFRAELPMTA